MSSFTGAAIRAARQARGWTQRQLAEYAGLSEIAIKRLEGGKNVPSGESLQRLAQALNVSTDTLMGRDDPLAGPFPASQLREWGISEPDLDQYRAAWPYWSHDQRVKFLGSLQLIINVRANVQAMTDEAQAKVRALENRANQDDDPDSAAQPFAQQVAM